NIMLFAQRRELHYAVATWYEQVYAEDLSPFYPFLAHDWRRANIIPKAIDYLELAGEQALRNNANEEAVAFFSQALELDREASAASRSEPDGPAPQQPALPAQQTLRRAQWELRLGEAY